MKKTQKYILLLMLLNIASTNISFGSPTDSLAEVRKKMGILLENRALPVYDVGYIKTDDWKELYRISEHPAFDLLLTPKIESEILSEINKRRKDLNKDTLLTADYFYIWKPYFDWLNQEDPHYRIYTMPGLDSKTHKSEKQFNNDPKSKRLAFSTLNINDTIIIFQSFDPLFHKGDMLLSINDVAMSEYLKYSYDDRYSSPLELMLPYYFSFAVDHFVVKLKRNGEELKIESNGHPVSYTRNNSMNEEYDVTTFKESKCGYVQIKRFYPNNSRLIKIVHNAIKDFKKNGCTSVILDLRRNPGGNGHSFDKLLSIFINQHSISYIKSQKLKVSAEIIGDYDFTTEDMIGKLVDMPEKYYVKEIRLDPKMYIEGLSYYVLISEKTGSIAASFANILQYNDAAKLAGEPLLRNALKYGETISGGTIPSTLLFQTAISTVEIDEYTKGKDGILTPDILIPFIAEEYLTGKDAILDRLLEIIKSKN